MSLEKKSLTPEQKAEIKKAKDDMKKMMDEERRSLSNVAFETREAMDRHKEEIERLERNLTKLKAAKEPVDTQVVKAESRINKWEAQRKSFRIEDKVDGLADQPVGDHTKVEQFKDVNEAGKESRKLLDARVALFETKIKLPEALFDQSTVFNSKINGFDKFITAEEISNTLLSVRKEVDEVIFDLETYLHQMKATLADGKFSKKEELQLYTEAAKIEEKIEQLKTSILDKIPANSNGEIDSDVDQKAVLVELCPSIAVVSNNTSEVFGSELKTDEEKAEGLETLKAALAEIDALPEPFDRLRAYSKTIAFGLDNELSKNLDKTEIEALFSAIANEKIPALFEEISGPEVAAEEGVKALEILSIGRNPYLATETMQAITKCITEKINDARDADSAYKSLVVFTEEFCQLSDNAIIASCGGSVDLLIATGLTDGVIKKVIDAESAPDASGKIADLAMVFAQRSNQRIVSSHPKRLFDLALSHLETVNIEDIQDNNSKEESDIVSVRPVSEHPITNEYQDTLRYIRDRMSELGLAHGETAGSEKTKDEMSARIEQLSQSQDRYGLALYATQLAQENHPDEAIKAIDLAQLYCFGDAKHLQLIADTFAGVKDEFYRNKTKEIYDSVIEAMRIASFMPAVAYIDLMKSLGQIDSNDQAVEVAEYVVDKISDTNKMSANGCLSCLSEFIKVSDHFVDEFANKSLFDLSLKISKNLYQKFSQDKDDRSKIVSLIGVMEKHDHVESAFELFADQIDGSPSNEAFDFIHYFRSVKNFESPFDIDGEISEEPRNKYIDKIINKVVSESTVAVSVGMPEATLAEVSPIVPNLVALYRELTLNGFNNNAESLFEKNIDLENQENLIGLVDMLSQDISSGEIQGLVDIYAKKAIEMSSDDFETTLGLMTHWADLDNNIYVEALASTRTLANGTFEKLVKLAETMNEHDIGLGLVQTVEEAEQAAKVLLEKESTAEEGLEKLSQVADLYDEIKLPNEGARLREDVTNMTEQMYQDQDGGDEQVIESDYLAQPELPSVENSQVSSGSIGRGVASVGSGTTGAKPQNPKNKGFLGFLRSLWPF